MSSEIFTFLTFELLSFHYICIRNKKRMEIIQFEVFGLHLQEPMALLTNWMIAGFSFFAYFNLKRNVSVFQNYWRNFYLILGISMLIGGLSHLFFHYTGIQGKFPSWSLGVLAAAFSSFAIISIWPNEKQQKSLWLFVIAKSIILLVVAIASRNFLFVAIDNSLAYLFFCGYMGYKLFKKNYADMKYIVIGVLVLSPSAFIFGLKLNLHRFLNKDDLSHFFIIGCIAFFYMGVKRMQTSEVKLTANEIWKNPR